MTGLLPYLVSLNDEGSDAFGVLPALVRCMTFLQDSCFTGLEGGLEAFYGLGSGLTPSGDDLILGMVLALNRCRAWIPDEAGLTRVNEQVIRAARAKTTSLSANLIECATLGQADERLVAALDGILTGNRPVEHCAQDLCSWGSTSGADALVGMALAITAFDR